MGTYELILFLVETAERLYEHAERFVAAHEGDLTDEQRAEIRRRSDAARARWDRLGPKGE